MGEFNGMAYPITKTPKGYFPVTGGIDLLKGDLLCLLLTNPGERIMNPTFGTPLRDLLFDPNDAVLADRARTMIINSINKWEPRIHVKAIDVYAGVDKDFLAGTDDQTQRDHVLGIRVMFVDPQNIREVQELVLQVPLQQGIV